MTDEGLIRIVCIEDDPKTIDLVKLILRREGFDVTGISNGRDGLAAIEQVQPHLVLLDLMMPDMDGWEVCRRLRELSDVPIVFITARSEIRDVVKGLEMGADDYVIKPYDNDELVARVRAHLRRSPGPAISEELVFDGGQFRVNFLNREVKVKSRVIHLTPKEFNLLGVLVRNAGRVITRTDLVKEAWGPEYADAIDSLKLYIHYLRQKIEADPQRPEYILTSRGVGYRFASH